MDTGSETAKIQCDCLICDGSSKKVDKKTYKKHITDFGHKGTVFLENFLSVPIDTPVDALFNKVLQYCVTRALKTSTDPEILEVKTGGKPISFLKMKKPSLPVSTPNDAIKRGINITQRKVTEFQANAIAKDEIEKKDCKVRLETAVFRGLHHEDKQYIASQCGLNKRPRIDSGDTVKLMSAANLNYNKMRVVRKELSTNVQFAAEKHCRDLEECYTVKYEYNLVPMEFTADADCSSLNKAGDKYLKKDTPVYHAGLVDLVSSLVERLHNADKLYPHMMVDNKVWIKVFIDADTRPSTKISVNIVNQDNPNAGYKHVPLIYSDSPDKEFNVEQLIRCFNDKLSRFDYTISGFGCKLLLCADTKQIWQLLGMPTSPGIHSCPLCKITQSDMQVPLIRRGKRPDRTYAGTVELYRFNREMTGLNRKDQRHFFNIIDKPKFVSAFNGMDDKPLIEWIVIPLVHINIRVGTDIWKKGLAITQEIDVIIANEMAKGIYPMNDIIPGTDFYVSVMKISKGETVNKITCGPYASLYTKACTEIGVRPEQYFGKVLNGNHCHRMIKRYERLLVFWADTLTCPIFDKRENNRIRSEIVDIILLYKTYGPIMRHIGRNERATDADIAIYEAGIERFMAVYRKIFKSVPPKLHFLEDHAIDQMRIFKLCLGMIDEQGGENSHNVMDDYISRFDNRADKTEVIKRALEKSTADSILKHGQND